MSKGWHRGTTPTNVFHVNVDLREATIFVTYSQKDKVIIEKTGEDVLAEEDTLTVSLSQRDTLAFRPGEVKIQIRYILSDGTADASNIIDATSEEILKDGEIKFV